MRIGRILIIFSFIGILSSIFLLSKSVYDDYIYASKYDAVYNYINKIDTEDTKKLKGVLEIPSINLKTGIVSNVDEGLMFVTNKLIAGHSGNCKACYFDKLDNLELGDNVYLYIDNEVEYKVDSIKVVDKKRVYINGDLNLITCMKDDKDRRLLISLVKVREENS